MALDKFLMTFVLT